MAKHVSGEVAKQLGLAYSKAQAQEQLQEYQRGFAKGVRGYKDNDTRMLTYYSGLVAPSEFFCLWLCRGLEPCTHRTRW